MIQLKSRTPPKHSCQLTKITNYYELDKKKHDRLLMNSITSTYGKADGNTISIINNEARNITTDLNIQDRVELMAEQQAFITLKDHKDNFENEPTCRLINPAESEIGRISNKILTNINTTIPTKTSLNQWKNSLSVIDWFSNIPDKQKFIIFDIENFYLSINDSLLLRETALQHHRKRHQHHYARQKISPFQQQRLTDQERPQHICCYHGKL